MHIKLWFAESKDLIQATPSGWSVIMQMILISALNWWNNLEENVKSLLSVTPKTNILYVWGEIYSTHYPLKKPVQIY